MRRFFHVAINAVLVCLFLSSVGIAQISVLTQRYDSARDGVNANETTLTPSNVNTSTFGKLFSLPVDGFVFAQPLYVPNVVIPGNGTHNVVYIATENDTVFAYDADGLQVEPLWNVNLATSSCPNGFTCTTVPYTDNTEGINTDIMPVIGITSTPVIDPSIDTIFVVAKTKEVSGGTTNYVYRLHALNITTGTEQPNSPIVIQGQVAGNGLPNSGGYLVFSPFYSQQRSGLALVSGAVYVAFGSWGDAGSWKGWLFGYDEISLAQLSAFSTTPNGTEGEAGIWMHGNGLASDSSGYLYFSTGNGAFDGVTNYGDTFLKLATPGLNVADYFTPYDQALLDPADLDIAAGGVMLLPDSAGTATYPHILIGCGKNGAIYVIDRDSMGQFNSSGDTQIIQELHNVIGAKAWSDTSYVDNCVSSPAYWQGNLYWGGVGDSVKMFSFANGLMSSTPASHSSESYQVPGANPVISANGTSQGIVWTIENNGTLTHNVGTAAILHAYDATNLANELYNSNQVAADAAGAPVKFAVPTVVNGKVYVETQQSVAVYGLLAPVITSATTASGTVGSAFSYQITASNAPTSYGATGLPAGLSVNSTSGLISGTPTTAGTLTVTLSATNSRGTGSASLTLTISNSGAPVITSATTASGTVGSAFSYQITASNSPTSYGATGLPAGLSVNSASGLISGTPTTAGMLTVTLSATNSGGTGNATLTLTIAPTGPPPTVITRNAHGVTDVGAKSTASPITVALSNVAAGDLIVCEVSLEEGMTFTSVSDPKNGNYSPAISMHTNTTITQQAGIYYVANAVAGSYSVSLAWTGGTAVWIAMACQSWTGAATSSPQDTTMTQQQDKSSTANPTTGSTITPAAAGELIIGCLTSSAHVPTAGTNYSLTDSATITYVWPEYWIQTTATATNAPYTNSSDKWTDQMVAFKPASDPPPVAPVITERDHGERDGRKRILVSDHGQQHADQLRGDGITGGLVGEQRDRIDLGDADDGGNIDGDAERDQQRGDRQRHPDADHHTQRRR